MTKALIRVLVVEDYEPFKRFARSTIDEHAEFQVISEVSDGLEAVRRAAELKPDLILLDIGLPKLNGIEAARQIRERSPNSKILFFSENRSPQIVEEALATGAGGYLLKSDAARELFAAMESVLQGKQFLSSSLSDRQDGNRPSLQTAVPRRRREEDVAGRHEVVFYSDDRKLIAKLSAFVGTALNAGNAAVIVATGPHQQDLIKSLQAQGVDIAAAIEQGRYLTLGAEDVVWMCVADGILDSARLLQCFQTLIEKALKAAKSEHPRVAGFGEGVDLMLKQGNPEAAIQDEKCGTELCQRYPVDILCAYSMDNLSSAADDGFFHQVCAEHSAVHRI